MRISNSMLSTDAEHKSSTSSDMETMDRENDMQGRTGRKRVFRTVVCDEDSSESNSEGASKTSVIENQHSSKRNSSNSNSRRECSSKDGKRSKRKGSGSENTLHKRKKGKMENIKPKVKGSHPLRFNLKFIADPLSDFEFGHQLVQGHSIRDHVTSLCSSLFGAGQCGRARA